MVCDRGNMSIALWFVAEVSGFEVYHDSHSGTGFYIPIPEKESQNGLTIPDEVVKWCLDHIVECDALAIVSCCPGGQIDRKYEQHFHDHDLEALVCGDLADDSTKLIAVMLLQDRKAEIQRRQLGVRSWLETKSRRAKYVYFARSEAGCKIGVTKNPAARVKQLNQSSPINVELVYTGFVTDAPELEKQLKKRFKEQCIQGEWFDLESADIRYIETVIKEQSNDLLQPARS